MQHPYYSAPAVPDRWLTTRLFWLAMALLLMVAGPVACNSKKKLAEEQARAEAEAKQRQVDALATELRAMMETPVKDMADLEARERRLRQIKDLGIADAGLDRLIAQVEAYLRSERARLEAPNQQPDRPDPGSPEALLKGDLDRYLQQIATAGSLEQANASIQAALKLFASPNTPVVRVIYRQDGQEDYDEPTTIVRYLEYIKDQKRNPNRVDRVELDGNGKVNALFLVKTQN